MENHTQKELHNEMETGIIQGFIGIRVSQNYGTCLFEGPYNRDHIILGSILRSPYGHNMGL